MATELYLLSAFGATPGFIKLEEEIDADAGITAALLHQGSGLPNGKSCRWTMFDSPAEVGIDFAGPALAGAEKTALDNLVAAHAGGNSSDSDIQTFIQGGASDNLLIAQIGGSLVLHDVDEPLDHGYHESLDHGYHESLSITSTSGGPDSKIDESPTLSGGVYRVHWSAKISATNNNDVAKGIMTVDAAEIDSQSVKVESNGNEYTFSGSAELTLVSGTRQFLLEIERVSGSGDANMIRARVSYERIRA